MRKFNVTVNGVAYEVEIEEVAAGENTSSAPATVAEKPAVKAEKTVKPVAAQGKSGANAIKAPMPGTIVKVNVKVGDSIKRGDVVCVIEAMKMESDICAPADGVVASVSAVKGASVVTDEVLVTFN